MRAPMRGGGDRGRGGDRGSRGGGRFMSRGGGSYRGGRDGDRPSYKDRGDRDDDDFRGPSRGRGRGDFRGRGRGEYRGRGGESRGRGGYSRGGYAGGDRDDFRSRDDRLERSTDRFDRGPDRSFDSSSRFDRDRAAPPMRDDRRADYGRERSGVEYRSAATSDYHGPMRDTRDSYGPPRDSSRMTSSRDRLDDRRETYAARPEPRDFAGSRDYMGARDPRDYRDPPPREAAYTPRESYGGATRDYAAPRDPYDARPPPRDYERQGGHVMTSELLYRTDSRGMVGGYGGAAERDYGGPRARPPMRRDSPNGRAPPPARSLERRPMREDRRDSAGRRSRDLSPPPFKRPRPDGPPPRDRSPIGRRAPPEYRGRGDGSPRGRGGYERRGGERGRGPPRR